MFIVPKDFRITVANIATLSTVLHAAARATLKANRLFPVHHFDGITDNSEEDVYQTTGYGDQNFSREGKYDWMFTYSEGGTCLHNSLRSFNVKGNYAIFYDADNILFGWEIDGEMAGIPLSIFKPQKLKINDGTNSTQFMLKVMFDAVYLNEESIYLDAGFLPSEISGLKDVELYEAAAQSVAATYNIGARLNCSKTDLYDLYSAELADGAVWTAANAATGAAVTITSVTANATLKRFEILVDAVDADYPAIAGSVVFNLVSPAALTTAGIEDAESIGSVSCVRVS